MDTVDFLLLLLGAVLTFAGFVLIIWGIGTLIPLIIRESKFPLPSAAACVIGCALAWVGYKIAAESSSLITYGGMVGAFLTGLILRNTLFAGPKEGGEEQ